MFTVDTPAGPFSVVADGATVLASGFTTDEALLVSLIHPSLRSFGPPDPAPIRAALEAYFAGDVKAVDAVAVRQRSGPFLEHAWDVLRGIHEPITYTEYADRAGNPAAIRAAASACARNSAAVFVPCHRVLRLDGSLGGYRWGLPVKRRLLAHESEQR
jgi:methylated-DNA-[protein]-cysteine S-methyltransferase